MARVNQLERFVLVDFPIQFWQAHSHGEPLKTLTNYLDDAKKKTGSDYKTAAELKCSTQYISKARKGYAFSNNMARRLAELLGVSPLEVIAAVEAGRDAESKKHWSRYVAAAFVAVLLFPVLYIMSTVRTASFGRLRAIPSA